MRYQSNGRSGGRQHATAIGWGCPLYATLPTQAVDAVLDGLHHTAIATALPLLGVAQAHAIRHDMRGQVVPVRAGMRRLAEATSLDLRTVLDALDDLLRPLPHGWPPILHDLTTRKGEVRATVDEAYSCPRDHVRVALPLNTDTHGAVVMAILIAENNRLSWPGDPATRLPYRPRPETVPAVNRYLRRADRDRLERYGIHLPVAVRRCERVMLHGPTRVLGVELEF